MTTPTTNTMDEDIITISSSSNSSSGCSCADLKKADDSNNKNQQTENTKSVSSDKNNGSITTEPVHDSDAVCNDWEIYETWTILGEPVMKPIITEPLPSKLIQQQLNAGQMTSPIVEKTPNNSIKANICDQIEHTDPSVVESDRSTVQNTSNILSNNNSLVVPNDTECRSDCDTPSDGISVISDCCDCVLHENINSFSDTSAQLADIDTFPKNFDTPPATPGTESITPSFKITPDLLARDSSEKFSIESRPSRSFDVVSPANIIIFSLLAGITGIVLGNAFRVRPEDDSSILNHISPLVMRIQDLERENSDLKSQLKKFKSANGGSTSSSTGPEMIFPQPLDFYLEQNINENGKQVWTGDPHNEGPITLENSKMKMPEFCNEDVGDDLFSERYQKICDEKVRKLSKIVQDSKEQPYDTVSSTCSGCQSCSTSSAAAKQSDVDSNFADDDESSVDRINLDKDKSQLKRKLKRQKPVKEDDRDSSSDTVTSDPVKPNAGCKKLGCTGIFEKRKKDKKNGNEDKENKKMKKSSDDWYEKRKSGRDEMRRSNGAASSCTDDWFTKRASNREKQRGSNSFDKKK